jgi:diacylglycerol O-acyltransferase / wax synthase
MADTTSRATSGGSAAQGDRRMNDSEALMWRLEKDPHLGSTFGTVSILDRPPDFHALRARMEQAVHEVPRLRWRVQPNPTDFGAPVWTDDPDFDIDVHVRRIALAPPGTRRELFDLAAVMLIDPWDRTRPLWQFTVIEGLRGGKAALLTKMHHTITDGEGGLKMSMQYLDVERNPPARPQRSPVDGDAAPPPTASALETARGLVEGSFRIPISLARQVGELLADPTSIPQATAAALDTVRSIVSQLSETDSARSPLWTHRSLRRRIETARVPFNPTKRAAERLGGTLNAAFITAAAEAAGRYHREHGAPVDELRASMAVSTRTSDSGSNAFSLARMLVPTGEMDIVDRFHAVSDVTTAARQGTRHASLDSLAIITSALPTSMITRIARQQAQTVDFATSNVRAAPIPLYIAGAQLLENYAIGPLLGVAFNLTLLSYDGNLEMGINIDSAAVDEPTRLAELVTESFKALNRAGR